MRMLRLFHRHFLLPAFESGLKRRKTFRYWKELEHSQWLPRIELEQLQLAALKRLLVHASSACPYYREAWLQKGFDPQKLQALDDFQHWPMIDAEVVRENRFRMRAQT